MAKFKKPKEIKDNINKLMNEADNTPDTEISLNNMYSHARGLINQQLNSESMKLNMMLLISLRNKMDLLEKMYKVIDKCLNKLLEESSLDTKNITTTELFDKSISLITRFASIVESLTNKNEVVNFNFTNNFTQQNVNGTIEMTDETREKMKILAFKFLMEKKQNQNIKEPESTIIE
jgi:hypothetical protein